MSNIPMGILAQAVVPYAADAVTFDGTNDYALRGADLTGNANAKVGTVSFWLDINVFAGNARIYETTGGAFTVQTNTGGTSGKNIIVLGKDTGATNRILMLSDNVNLDDGAWHHILMSWDVANAKGHVYVDDVDDLLAGPTISDAAIDYTQADHALGSDTGGGGKLNGDLFDLYMNFAEYVDITIASNRRKFISASGKPVDLGSDFSNPTGTSPINGFHIDTGEAADNFANNRGTGGNFTVTGALTTAASSPTD